MRQPTRDDVQQAEAALKRAIRSALLILGVVWTAVAVAVMLIVARGMAG